MPMEESSAVNFVGGAEANSATVPDLSGVGGAGSSGSGNSSWACAYCTYINRSGDAACEMCSLPP